MGRKRKVHNDTSEEEEEYNNRKTTKEILTCSRIETTSIEDFKNGLEQRLLAFATRVKAVEDTIKERIATENEEVNNTEAKLWSQLQLTLTSANIYNNKH